MKPLPIFGFLSLSDLPLSFYISDEQNHVGAIIEHPYFRSLNENDLSIFNDFCQSKQHLPNMLEYSWEGFLALKQNISIKGWLPQLGSDIIVRDGGQLDGAHRLSILCHLYGPDAQVMIVDGKITFPIPTSPEEKLALLQSTIEQVLLEKKSIDSLVLERDLLTGQLLEAQLALKMLADEKKALLTSHSWKITHPFRAMKDWLTGH